MLISTVRKDGVITKTITLVDHQDCMDHIDNFVSALDALEPDDEDVLGFTLILRMREAGEA